MSIRPWLGYTHTLFRSRSPDIAYLDLHYANGRFVAVGRQREGANNAIPGVPVTCAGCSWSDDGLSWQDSQLPFAGLATSYQRICWRPDATNPLGVWQAISNEFIVPTAVTANYVCSTNNALGWASDPSGRQASVQLQDSMAVGNTFWAIGQTTNNNRPIYEKGTGFKTGSVRTTDPAGSFGYTACCCVSPTQALMMTGGSYNIWNGTTNTITNFPAWAIVGAGVSGTRAPGSLIFVPGIGYVALISDLTYDEVIANQGTTNQAWRFRSIWTSPTGTAWTLRATLPYVQGVKGPYYKLAYGSGTIVACGNGLLMSSADAVNWREVAVPAGVWTAIASDGTDFVVVSGGGDRIKLSGASIATAARSA